MVARTPPHIEARIVRDCMDGMTAEEAGRRHGVSGAGAARIFRRNTSSRLKIGKKRRDIGFPGEDLIALVEQCGGYRQVARKLGDIGLEQMVRRRVLEARELNESWPDDDDLRRINMRDAMASRLESYHGSSLTEFESW